MAGASYPRIRPDLAFSRVVQRGETSYIVKDPMTGDYVRLDELSGALAQQMDGRRSLEDLVAWASETWPSIAFDMDYMDDMVRELKQMRFIEDPFDRSALVLQKARAERAKVSLSMFKNVTQIDLGVFDPDAFLDRTKERFAFAFARPFVMGVMALFALSCVVLWARRDHLNLSLQDFFTLPGASLPMIVLLWVVLLLTTVGHELGHAYTVKRWGGQVNRMGFMMMFGLPCLFCDVSDSHMFNNWKHKIYVALGGIYADIMMAVGATVLWWATPDGALVNDFAARVMLFCGVSGILMNANPLVKLDGYYVVAEYLEMPELREQAFKYAGYLFRRHVLRVPLECPVTGRSRKRILFVFFALSFFYSGLLLLVFYLWARTMLIDWLGFLGALVGLVALYYFFKRPIEHTHRSAREWYLTHRAGIAGRHWIWGGLGAALLLVALLLPVPGIVTRQVTLMPGRIAAVRAPEELFLRDARFVAGERVGAGDTLALLDAREFKLGAARLGREAQAERRRAWAAAAQGAASEAASAQVRGRALDGEAAVYRRLANHAVLRAPFEGQVLSLAARDRLGERMAAGETLCVVGDLSRLRAGLDVAEAHLADFAPGAPVRARLVGDPSVTLRGRIASIEWAPREAGGVRYYRAWLSLEGGAGRVKAGQTAVARVRTTPRTLAAHFVRWLTRWVRADLLV